MALAKARICAGLATATGRLAAARAATTTVSKPPVASSTMRFGFNTLRRATRSASPAPVRETAKRSPLGRTATSRRSFDTSIPTVIFSMATRPCLSELAVRPRRLFGFDGTAGGVPGSQTVLDDLGVDGHPPATAPRLLGESGKRKLQGVGMATSSPTRRLLLSWGRGCGDAIDPNPTSLTHEFCGATQTCVSWKTGCG